MTPTGSTATALPTAPVPHADRQVLRRSFTAFNWSGGLRTTYDTFASPGSFVFVAFALAAGVTREKIGLFTALASFACVAEVLALPLLNRVRDKKRFILAVGVIEPLLLIATVLLLPWLPAGGRIAALALTVLLGATAVHATRPLTESWIATIVPVGVRNRFIGRRVEALTACAIGATLAAGWLAERVDRANTFGLGCLLAVGALFGLAAVLALRGAVMPAVSAMSRVTWPDLRDLFRQPLFRRYLLGIVLYNVPFLFAMPYYQVFHLSVLHLPASRIAYLSVGYFLVKALAVRAVGQRADRVSRAGLLLVSGPVFVLFFAGFALSEPGRIWPLALGWAIAGLGEAAYSVAATAALYAAAPHSPARPVYFAVGSLVNMAAIGTGALLAVPVLEVLRGLHVQLGPLHFGQFQCFFALCTVLMIPSLFAARFFSGPESAQPRNP